MSGVPVDFRGFTGMNSSIADDTLNDEQLSLVKNAIIDNAGILHKRNGFRIVGDSTDLSSGGGSPVIVLGQRPVGSGKTFHTYFSMGVTHDMYYTIDFDTYTVITKASAGLTNRAMQLINYGDYSYLLQRAVGTILRVHKDDVATFTSVAGSYPADFGVIHQDRLFIVHNALGQDQNRLRYSGPGDPSAWTATQYIDVSPGDGDVITAIVPFYENLLIFKEHSTWILATQGATPANWVLRQVNSSIGCSSEKTPQEYEGFVYFVGPQGVYRTDGQIFTRISQPVQNYFRDKSIAVTVDSGIIFRDHYLISVLIGEYPDDYSVTLLYNLRTEGWVEWALAGTHEPYSHFIARNESYAGLYAVGGPSTRAIVPTDHRKNIYFYDPTIFTDVGATYEFRAETKRFDFEDPSKMKRGMWCLIDAQLGDGKVASIVQTPEGDSYNDYGSIDNILARAFEITGEEDSQRKVFKIGSIGYFRKWKLVVSEESNTDFKFFGATLVLKMKNKLSKTRF